MTAVLKKPKGPRGGPCSKQKKTTRVTPSGTQRMNYAGSEILFPMHRSRSWLNLCFISNLQECAIDDVHLCINHTCLIKKVA